MMQDRRQLRALLRALIAERGDAQGLYIPRGDAGQRRMILALLDMRPPREDDPLAPMIEAFLSGESRQPGMPSASPMSEPDSSARTRGV